MTTSMLEVVLLDRSSGSDVPLDVSQRYDGPGTTLNRPSWDKSKVNQLLLKFSLLEVPAMYAAIHPRMEVWAGVRDGDGNWTNVVFGGYTRKVKWSETAGERYCLLDLDTYDLLFDTTMVHGWPCLTGTDDWGSVAWHSPLVSTDFKIDGYPPGYTPRDWLTGLSTAHGGGKPFDGLIPFYLQGTDLNGIEGSLLATFTFEIYSRPGNVEVPGFFMAMTLRQAVEMVLQAYATLAIDVNHDYPYPQPVYWMGAIADPADTTRIIPQFRVKDLGVP